MKLFVDILFINMKQETFCINIDNKTELNKAKILLQKESYVYPEEQIWFCDNTMIPNNKIINWNEKSIYSVIVNNKWYSFDIKTMTNAIINVNYLTSRDPISTIKYHIYEKIKLLPNNYVLTCKKNNETIVLNDNDVIGQYFIPNNSVINLVINLNSGFR